MAYIEIDNYGITRYHDANHKLHREDGPAMIWSSGQRVWYWHGQPRRENGPAYCAANGLKKWYEGGLIWPKL